MRQAERRGVRHQSRAPDCASTFERVGACAARAASSDGIHSSRDGLRADSEAFQESDETTPLETGRGLSGPSHPWRAEEPITRQNCDTDVKAGAHDGASAQVIDFQRLSAVAVRTALLRRGAFGACCSGVIRLIVIIIRMSLER